MALTHPKAWRAKGETSFLRGQVLPQAMAQDHRDNDILFIFQMPDQEVIELEKVGVKVLWRVGLDLQHGVGGSGKACDQGIKGVVIGIEQGKCGADAGVNSGHHREVMVIFNLVVAVQGLQQVCAVMRKALGVDFGRHAAIQKEFGI